MEVANAMIVISDRGSNVPKAGVTPAEAALLRKLHLKTVGGNCVTQLEILEGQVALIVTERNEDTNEVLKTRPRTSRDELQRLRGRYSSKLVESLWPGENPTLPETFKEVGFEPGLQFQQESKVEIGQPNKTQGFDADSMLFTSGEMPANS